MQKAREIEFRTMLQDGHCFLHSLESCFKFLRITVERARCCVDQVLQWRTVNSQTPHFLARSSSSPQACSLQGSPLLTFKESESTQVNKEEAQAGRITAEASLRRASAAVQALWHQLQKTFGQIFVYLRKIVFNERLNAASIVLQKKSDMNRPKKNLAKTFSPSSFRGHLSTIQECLKFFWGRICFFLACSCLTFFAIYMTGDISPVHMQWLPYHAVWPIQVVSRLLQPGSQPNSNSQKPRASRAGDFSAPILFSHELMFYQPCWGMR